MSNPWRCAAGSLSAILDVVFRAPAPEGKEATGRLPVLFQVAVSRFDPQDMESAEDVVLAVRTSSRVVRVHGRLRRVPVEPQGTWILFEFLPASEEAVFLHLIRFSGNTNKFSNITELFVRVSGYGRVIPNVFYEDVPASLPA